MIQFDEHIFQRGWFNHQLEKHGGLFYGYFSLPEGNTPEILKGTPRTRPHPERFSHMNMWINSHFYLPI